MLHFIIILCNIILYYASLCLTIQLYSTLYYTTLYYTKLFYTILYTHTHSVNGYSRSYVLIICCNSMFEMLVFEYMKRHSVSTMSLLQTLKH